MAVPTRNRATSLRESLRSICNQEYEPVEILISDNGSEDDTEALCRELASGDPRVRYVRHDVNIGLHGNHNFCMDEARGEYLCICHDHDRRDLGIVREYVAFLEEHPNVGVVCSDWELFDDSGARIGVRDHRVKTITPGMEYIDQTMRSGRSSIGIPGAMIRRSALGPIRFEEEAPIGFGDFPIWFKLAESADVGHISRRLWSWRQNRESHSARPIVDIAVDYRYNIERYCDDHLARRPSHRDRVAQWRRDTRRYLFWALAYEVGLYFRDEKSKDDVKAARTLFEIMNYRLTPEQFQHALEQMSALRDGPGEHFAFATVQAMLRLHLTRPLGWVTRHQSTARAVLGLR
jgi:glycosyltransferase involved in cell wall biosynthesis